MHKTDRTFDDISAYGSERWCAARCGIGYDSWRKDKRRQFEAEGFPQRDPITGMTLKADVDAWLEKRRRVSDPAGVIAHDDRPAKVNFAAL